MFRFAAGLFVLVTLNVGLAAGQSPLLLQHPTLSATQIAFVYAGDLWTAPCEGGVAQRLTAGIGTVSRPAFSPEGSEESRPAVRGRLRKEFRTGAKGIPR
jgi:tricorn protease